MAQSYIKFATVARIGSEMPLLQQCRLWFSQYWHGQVFVGYQMTSEYIPANTLCVHSKVISLFFNVTICDISHKV